MSNDATRLGPTSERERIQVLDLIRAVALLGILLVNIEFFNRQLGERGLPLNSVGLDRFIGAIIYYGIEGKAWILFALLFGIGMAMTTIRSEVGRQPNLLPYCRRIVGLAVFGAIHCIMIWRGDILFLYSVAAVGLLLVLYCPTKYALVAMVAAIAIGVLSGLDRKASYGLCILMLGLAGIYVQNEKRFRISCLSLDIASTLLMGAGCTVLAVTAGLGAIRGISTIAPMMLVRAGCLLLAGIVALRFREDLNQRILVSAIGLYCLPLVLVAVTGLLQFENRPGLTAPSQAETSVLQSGVQPASEESVLLTHGDYIANVVWRARFFVRNAFSEASLVTPTVAIFLIGVWIVRSGAIAKIQNSSGPTSLLAIVAVLIGYGLTSVGKYLESKDVSNPTVGMASIASGVIGLGSLAASLGLLAVIVKSFSNPTSIERFRYLLPVGRLALTNYLIQSIVCGYIFYGYGMGHWGLGRSGQVSIAAALFALQIVFSNVWLAWFVIGPCEWCLRAVTYWRLPSFVRSSTV